LLHRKTGRVAPLGACVVVVALGLSGCGDDSPGTKAEPSSTPAPTTTTAPAPPTTFPPAQAEALRQAVIDYEEDQGFGTTFFEVRNLLLSTADSNWARFNVAPTPGNESRVQPAFGVASFDGAAWTVVDVGTADVGCAPIEVPEPVRQSLQLGCPPG
jgi:hypothetical protein